MVMWIQGTVLSYHISSGNAILSGVQRQVSLAISHLQFFSLTLKAWMCEQWEQICTWCICKFPEELIQWAMLWVSWSEIHILIIRNFEKVCDEEAETGRTKVLHLNKTRTISTSFARMLIFFSVLCRNNVWLCSLFHSHHSGSAVRVAQLCPQDFWRFWGLFCCCFVCLFCWLLLLFFSVSSILKLFHDCSVAIRKGKKFASLQYKTKE